MDFCHLHVHSEKSWFDSIIKVPQLINQIKREGMNTVSLTDHHHILAWAELESHANKQNIKPLFGIEINVHKFHVTAIAMNEKGIGNIIALNNLGHRRKVVRVTKKELIIHKEGVYFLSGCSKSELNAVYQDKGPVALAKYLEECKQIFGDFFAIELTSPFLPSDMLNVLYILSKKMNIKIVATNDCHYLKKEDSVVYNANLWLRTRGKIQSENHHRYLKSSAEMCDAFRIEWLYNSVSISDQCKVHYSHFIRQMNNIADARYPLSIIERYNDVESLEMVCHSQKEYKKGKNIVRFMRKSDYTLEDLLKHEEYADITRMAFGIRNTIKTVKEDTSNQVISNVLYTPLMKNKKNSTYFAQWTLEDAEYLNLTIV